MPQLIGTVWQEDVWDPDAWAADVWGPLGSGITSVEVFPALITLVVSQTTTFVAVSYDDGHAPIAEDHTWASDDTLVATVHPTSGLVTAIGVGTANITATGVTSGLTDSGVVQVVDPIVGSGGSRKGHRSPFTFARRRR